MSLDQLSSDFLFVRPRFFRGLAHTLDITGSIHGYNWSRNGDEADALAMFADWALVGKDLASAMEQFAKTSTVDDNQLALSFNPAHRL